MLIVYDKQLGIDESTPVIHPMKIKSRLDAFVLHLVEVILKVLSVPVKCLQEEHTGIESQNTIFGEGVDQRLAVPVLVFTVELMDLGRQIVSIEIAVNVGVQGIEIVQAIPHIGLPFRIAKEGNIQCLMLFLQHAKGRSHLLDRFQRSGSGNHHIVSQRVAQGKDICFVGLCIIGQFLEGNRLLLQLALEGLEEILLLLFPENL